MRTIVLVIALNASGCSWGQRDVLAECMAARTQRISSSDWREACQTYSQFVEGRK